ncbi:MAG: hypothetical protein ACXADY_26470 [Candidatus Hodarchaeales archaeon]|jgi:hypothetical protein
MLPIEEMTRYVDVITKLRNYFIDNKVNKENDWYRGFHSVYTLLTAPFDQIVKQKMVDDF